MKTHLARWIAITSTVTCALACAACGDDESATPAEGSGGGGSSASTTSSTTSAVVTTGDATCPAAEPLLGKPCENPGIVCAYDYTVECDGSLSVTDTATCTNGYWEIEASEECVLPEPCPETTPVAGTGCPLLEEDVCHYEQEATCFDGSLTHAEIDATCGGDGVWSLESDASAECCPGAPPPDGQVACGFDEQTCNFEGDVVCEDGGSIGGAVESTCTDGRWHTVYEPSGGLCEGETPCPEAPPATGEACTIDDGTECLWEKSSECPDGAGRLLIDVASCGVSGTWAASTLFEGDNCGACPEEPFDDCDVEGMACVMTYLGDCTDSDEGSDVTVGVVCEDGAWVERWHHEVCND